MLIGDRMSEPGHLPKDQHAQVQAAIRAAWKLEAKDGEQRFEQLARWLERDHPSAAVTPKRRGLACVVETPQPRRIQCTFAPPNTLWRKPL